jgi:hypothetical protein
MKFEFQKNFARSSIINLVLFSVTATISVVIGALFRANKDLPLNNNYFKDLSPVLTIIFATIIYYLVFSILLRFIDGLGKKSIFIKAILFTLTIPTFIPFYEIRIAKQILYLFYYGIQIPPQEVGTFFNGMYYNMPWGFCLSILLYKLHVYYKNIDLYKNNYFQKFILFCWLCITVYVFYIFSK